MDNTQSAPVNVVDPGGRLVSVPANQVATAMEQGYSPATKEALAQYDKEEKFGTPAQQIKAGVEGLGRGATLGFSDVLARMGGENMPDVRARQEVNSGTSTLTSMAGGAGLVGLTGGIAAPLEEAMVGAKVAPIAARALGYAAEGATFGAGNVVSDAAMGDTKINAQKILADIGMGAAFGGGLGVLSKGIEAVPSIFRSSAEAAESGASVPHETSDVDGALSGGEPKETGAYGKSLSDLEAMNKKADMMGVSDQLPTERKAVDSFEQGLKDDGIDVEFGIHDLQKKALEEKGTADLYRTAKEMNNKEGKTLRDTESVQKWERQRIVNDVVDTLHSEGKPVVDNVEGGDAAAKALNDVIQTNRNELGPKIGELKATQVDKNHLPGVIDAITSKDPEMAELFDTSADGLKLKPYDSGKGITATTYRKLKVLVNDLQKDPNDFGRLFNLRKNLTDGVGLAADKDTVSQLTSLKASMMDYIQKTIQEENPSQPVRDFFKRYAINEQNANTIEKKLGVNIDNGFRTKDGKPLENVLDKIFKDTETVKAARDILGESKFNDVLANNLKAEIAAASKDGFFSSKKFDSYLTRKQDVMNEAFAANPRGLRIMKNALGTMRILPDAASVNPSGTAKTLYNILKDVHGPVDLLMHAKKALGDELEKKFIANKINNVLSGKADQAKKLGAIQSIVDKTTAKIESGVKSIFTETRGNRARGATLEGLTDLSNRAYNERVKRLRELSSDPQNLVDHMSDSSDALYAAAPNITQDIHTSMAASLGFLTSKIPQPAQQMPLSPEFKPSQAQMQKFNTYYSIVNDPISTLDHVKSGALNNDMMEAMNSTHPELLQEMRMKVMENFKLEKAKDLPQQTKISLAKFLGQPMDASMLPQNIMAYQASLMTPMQTDGAMKPTQKGLSELGSSGRAETRSQVLGKGLEG